MAPDVPASTKPSEISNTSFKEKYRTIEHKLAADLKKLKKPDLKPGYKIQVKNCLKANNTVFEKYVEKFKGPKQVSVLYLGMNPSWKAKNAIPFDYADEKNNARMKVRKWLKIPGDANEVPPDLSGETFWSFIEKSCGTAKKFYEKCIVRNYCPIAFGMERNNRTRDASLNCLPAWYGKRAMQQIRNKCDEALKEIIELLLEDRGEVRLHIVILGQFQAEGRIRKIIKQIKRKKEITGANLICGPYQLLHPKCRITVDDWELLTLKRFVKNDNGIFNDIFHGEYDGQNEVPYHAKTFGCLQKMVACDVGGLSGILKSLRVNDEDSETPASEDSSSQSV